MQTVNFKCGHCGNLMGVSTDFLGQQVRCPHCQKVVVAPAAKGALQETTLQLPPSSPPLPNLDETAVLSPPAGDEASIFHEGPTDDLFGEPKPPPLDLSTPANEPTLNLEPGSIPTPVATPSPADEASVAPDIPDWMKPATPGPMTSANGALAAPISSAPAQSRRRMSLGLLLFVSLVFMPLVLYAVLVTILAILIYGHNPQQPDPREDLIDTQGDHPGAKKVLKTDVQGAIKPLPPQLRVKVGDTIDLGQLRVTATGVERGTVKMTTPGFDKPDEIETLVLRLHLKNVSNDAAFYPMDYWFARKWSDDPSVRKGQPPLTVLLAGDQLRFFGGPAVWNQETVRRNSNPERRDYLTDCHYDRELKAGEEMDTFVCVNGNDPKWDELAEYKGSFVWHVHVRRGFVHYKDHDYPATAVFGVEFTDADIKAMK